MDSYIQIVDKMSPNNERARPLKKQRWHVEMLDPMSIADDLGFLTLMHEAEHRYLHFVNVIKRFC
jgi:hypothetical protein